MQTLVPVPRAHQLHAERTQETNSVQLAGQWKNPWWNLRGLTWLEMKRIGLSLSASLGKLKLEGDLKY